MPAVIAVAGGLKLAHVKPTEASSDREPLPVSTCQAVAEGWQSDKVQLASAKPVNREQVRISFIGHSTYLIETPEGVTIATDYNGYIGNNDAPTVVTMNKAHSSHYTLKPDPAIENVLPGWNPNGGPIDHDVVVSDTYIRNVTTDIRSGFGSREADANSIFIFEVAGLCIGHLGHLHHDLEDRHIAQIGRLDVVMVPIDGGLTVGHERMSDIVKRLRASVILPMHRRGTPINAFLDLFGEDFDRQFREQDNLTVTLRDLPKQPTIIILQGV
ncbi:MBL fold metallo-hydrolase [Hoeflea prorocentri]|uniref:MBL fold metallo-hydrolase n=1 Tax=Hoeflea prorocentri TaxID=1922333 RepID=A0A9X3ZFW3_9HYPH|nr:MBL fold metallo-hydrolase [Hoeflea prorocentri]MCY6379302.1 MBL fold metallo-hydrolase [Hoeflea prorocentri]MDA5397103.1 MBL fold metallo-hydrolase [Hoeflea prorocentri]